MVFLTKTNQYYHRVLLTICHLGTNTWCTKPPSTETVRQIGHIIESNNKFKRMPFHRNIGMIRFLLNSHPLFLEHVNIFKKDHWIYKTDNCK